MEIGIIFVEQYALSEGVAAGFGASLQDAFSGFVVCHQIEQAAAFRCGVLRVRVVIVESRAVAEYPVAFDFREGEIVPPVAFFRLLFIGMIGERLRPEAALITKRIFASVVPHRLEISRR